MVIRSSDVAMQSQYSMVTYQAESVSYTGWGGFGINLLDSTATTTPLATDSEQNVNVSKTSGTESINNDTIVASNILTSNSSSGIEQLLALDSQTDVYKGNEKVEYDSFDSLMMLLYGESIKEEQVSYKNLFQKLLEQYKSRAEALIASLGRSNGVNCNTLGVTPTQELGYQEVVVEEMTVSNLHYEKEATTFASQGTVLTEDGREIEFNIDATMSRSYLQYAGTSINYKHVMMVDPLVINLGSGTAEVSDQKFLFDIDADGEEDNISLLGEMCGYLALDANEDGVINDGSELFGTKTGDGFGELAVYDLDNNGWIDESDEIFNRLRIWTKDSNGNDKLVGLGVAGVGCIYLGNATTTFSINSKENNDTNAMIRETGIYLREDGSAGTIQHVDMAT